MKTLYLVRHAKSSWDNPNLADSERPLNKRGKRDAPMMGQRLKTRGIMPDLMVSSSANRALTTCKNIAKEIGYPEKHIQIDDRIYHAGIQTLIKVVQEAEDIKSLMLFGHNPSFTEFSNTLAGTGIWNIPTCGVFACSFKVKTWKEIEFGGGKLVFYDYPKNLS